MKRRRESKAVLAARAADSRDILQGIADATAPRDDDDLAMPPSTRPLTRRDFTMPDEIAARGITPYLKLAEEHAGKCAAALELAIEGAQRDVVLARSVSELADLLSRAKRVREQIDNMRTGT